MEDAVRHQLDMNRQENELRYKSESLSKIIVKAKDDSNRKLENFLKLFDRISRRDRSNEYGITIARSIDILKAINKVINHIYNQYTTIAEDAV